MGDFVEAVLERIEVFFGNGAARRHGVAAKTQQHAGVAFGHQVECVAQVKPRDRAPRPFQLMLLARCGAGGEDKGGAVQLVFDAGGHDADHTFVKVGVKHANSGWRLIGFVEQRLGNGKRLLAHVAFNVAALAVDAIQHFGQLVAARGVVGEQAFNAQRHVRQAPGGVDAGPQGKAKVKRGGCGGLATRCYKKRS